MPSKYARKTNQQNWDPNSMAAAIEAVKSGTSLQKAAKQHNVPATTLFRRLRMPAEFQMIKQLGRFRNVFSSEQENMIVEYILKMEGRLFGLTISDLKSLAYQFATRNNIKHNFNDDKEQAGKDWVIGFLKRHKNLSLRLPEPTSAARASAFNEVNVGKFFDLLDELYDKHKYPPNRIYNCDETGITTVPKKPSRIISKKGKKQVGALASAERGTLTTAEICFNAAGEYIPPALIYPRVRHCPTFEVGVPPNTQIYCHSSGWMQTEIFTTWFQHFLKYAKPSADDRVLLILDGHATHIKNIEMLELAKQHYVDVLVLPPHCTHRLQPLDVAFMFPLSTYYEQAVRVWLRENPGKVVTIHEVGKLFGEAYMKAANMSNAISGFRKSGIWPFERPDPSAYVAAETTERPLPSSPTSLDLAAPSQHRATDYVLPIVSLETISPIPQVSGSEKRKRKSRAGKSVLATSSPYIQDLKDKHKVHPPEAKKIAKATKHLFQEVSDSDLEECDNVSLYNDTDSGSEEEDKGTTEIQTQEMKEGAYVAVQYENNVFPGKILKRDGDVVTITCMEQTNKYFKWPIKEDILDYNLTAIKMIINEPKKLKRGFYNVPELSLYKAFD